MKVNIELDPTDLDKVIAHGKACGEIFCDECATDYLRDILSLAAQEEVNEIVSKAGEKFASLRKQLIDESIASLEDDVVKSRDR